MRSLMRALPRNCFKLSLIYLLSIFAIYVHFSYRWSSPSTEERSKKKEIAEEEDGKGNLKSFYSSNKDLPLIFIAGVPRSGTTLMRSMLDAHPEIGCGEETHIIPHILEIMIPYWKSSSTYFEALGITEKVVFSAIGSFVLEVITTTKHSEIEKLQLEKEREEVEEKVIKRRICNKDPRTALHTSELSRIFPKAKFIFMVRDGRAVAHSALKINKEVSHTDILKTWNILVSKMYPQCLNLTGESRCLMIYYEHFVRYPSSTMHRVLEFLDVPWNEAVLHHERYINKPGGVFLSKIGYSNEAVKKPVYLDSLTDWSKFIPDEVKKNAAKVAPMLIQLGYDVNSTNLVTNGVHS